MSKKNKSNNMKKSNNNRNSSNTNYYGREMELPEMINMDALAYASDDDLERRYGFISSERDKASQHGIDLYPWEVEIAYVQREMKNRHARRLSHERYIRINPDTAFYDETFQRQSDVTHN